MRSLSSRLLAVSAASLLGLAISAAPAFAEDTATLGDLGLSLPGGAPIEEALGNDSVVQVGVDWAFPDEASPGDEFYVGLPDELTENFAPSDFELKTDDEEVAGDCHLESRTMTCVMSDFMADHTDVHGTVWLVQTLDTDVTGQNVPVTMVFDLNGVATPQTVTVSAPPSPDPTVAAKYSGWREGTTAWEIYLPNTVYAATPVTIVDRPGPGQSCPSASAPDVSLWARNADGSLADVIGSIAPTVAADGSFTVVINEALNTYPLYTVHYECDITDDTLGVYHNTATISAAGDSVTVTGEVWALLGDGVASGNPMAGPTPTVTPTTPTPTATTTPTAPVPTNGGGGAPAPTTTAGSTSTPTSAMPNTGSTTTFFALAGIGILLLGAGVVIVVRRSAILGR